MGTKRNTDRVGSKASRRLQAFFKVNIKTVRMSGDNTLQERKNLDTVKVMWATGISTYYDITKNNLEVLIDGVISESESVGMYTVCGDTETSEIPSI